MNDNLVCKGLVEFTGLDEESTKTQVLPYLRSLKSRVESEEYLSSLIGQGQKQAEFIERYCNSNLRKKPELAKNESAFPSLPSSQKTSQSHVFGSSTNQGFSRSSDRSKGKQTQSSTKIASDPQNNQIIHPNVYNNFGNPANVYMKTRDPDKPGSASSSFKNKNFKSSKSEAVALESKPNSTTDLVPTATTPKANSKPAKSDSTPDVDIPISELSSAVLKEIFQVVITLQSIESPSVHPQGTAQCFCQARSHGQPLSQLPKQCMNCGLIYCRIKPASSPCPSCNEPSRLSTNSDLKENLRNEFINKRNSLIEMEIEKYKRRLSLEQQREALAREAERDYPTLPKTSTSNAGPTRATLTGSNTPSYSSQLDHSRSIQNQIKLGYERLAKTSKEKSNSKSKSHTVVRLQPNGKTKIITTSQKNAAKNTQQEVKFDQIFNPTFLATLVDDNSQDAPPPHLDAFDDLFRITSNKLQPVLFLEKQSPPVPKYVPVGIYQV